MKKLNLDILFIILLFFCCWTSASNDCQGFCSFDGSEHQFTKINEEYKWCKNVILKGTSYITISQSVIAELINNGNFSYANVYVALEDDGDQHFNNETLDFLHSVAGISLLYEQNITSFDKIRKELPHLKLIIEFKYASYVYGRQLISFLKEHAEEFHAADYLVFDKQVDLSKLPDNIKEKFVLELDKETLELQAKSLGIKAFLNGIKHVSIDVLSFHYGILDSGTLKEKTDTVDRNFVCPVSASVVHLPPIIYCYYQLPRQNDISVLTPDEIPAECNRIIVKGFEITNGAIIFKDDVNKSYMELFSATARIVASISCKKFYLDIGPPVHESTLIENLINFVESYNLDGLEIDCEYLHEIESYTDFLIELKNKLGSSKILGIQLQSCYYSHSECNPLAQSSKSICDINNTVIESLDYYRIKTSSPSFFESINYIMNPNLGKSNRTKKLVAVSSHGVFFRVAEYHVNHYNFSFQEVQKKKRFYPSQYDYDNGFAPGGYSITEIAYDSTLKYKEMCTRWPEVFSQNSTILNDTKNVNAVSKYDSNSNNFYLSLDNGKLYYDNPAVMKYYSSKNIGALAFDSLNDDDWEGACGQGKFPVFKSFFNAHL